MSSKNKYNTNFMSLRGTDTNSTSGEVCCSYQRCGDYATNGQGIFGPIGSLITMFTYVCVTFDACVKIDCHFVI